jgi:hypothetical protein
MDQMRGGREGGIRDQLVSRGCEDGGQTTCIRHVEEDLRYYM